VKFTFVCASGKTEERL